MAARTHPLHNFLSGVASLGETNVRRFERGFVRNYCVVEIVGEPWNSGLETQRVERGHADRRAVRGVNSCVHAVPKQPEMFARRDNFRTVAAKARAADKVA